MSPFQLQVQVPDIFPFELEIARKHHNKARVTTRKVCFINRSIFYAAEYLYSGTEEDAYYEHSYSMTKSQ
jgi:hypothetical protein